MSKNRVTVKLDEETHKKLKKLKNLREFELECDLTISELIEEMMEDQFKKYDNLQIKKVR